MTLAVILIIIAVVFLVAVVFSSLRIARGSDASTQRQHTDNDKPVGDDYVRPRDKG
jgi:hypothetical protein